MNIFYVDESPIVAAQSLCDKHVCKMIVESAQMLSTAHIVNNSPAPYKAAYVNHPCNIWVRQSKYHYYWLLSHTVVLIQQYNIRYNKQHKTSIALQQLYKAPINLSNNVFVAPPQCMPDQFKDTNTVTAYRKYYINDKVAIKGLKWSRGIDPPQWLYDQQLLITC
jgi:hypothetical protein